MTFEFIYEKYFDDIYRYCCGRNGNDEYYAQEATKLTFDVVWRDWETVKEYPSERFLAWLYGVAKNKIKDDLTRYLYNKTKRKPMILPVITDV